MTEAVTTCKICKKEINGQDADCPYCGYPLKGTEKEQSQFIGKQIHLEYEAVAFVKKMKRIRYVYLVIALSTTFDLLTTPYIDIFSFAIVAILIVLFVLCFIFNTERPVLTSALAFSTVMLNHLIVLILMPQLFFYGIIMKGIIIFFLTYALVRSIQMRNTLKKNPYLAFRVREMLKKPSRKKTLNAQTNNNAANQQ